MMVSMASTTATLTFEEFERLPDQPGKRELLKGELIELPPAELKHNKISHIIFLRLYAALAEAHARGDASELGEVYHEMGYKLEGDGYVQPDVSITHTGQTESKYLGGAPAVAIEVVSPGNTAEALDLKTELYFQYGAREVWRFYPKTRQAWVQIAGSSQVSIEREAIRTSLLPGFELKIAEIFAA
jgi:Uma2 family endonuclease